MGCNCKKGTKNPNVADVLQSIAQGTAANGTAKEMNIVDQDFEMVIYMHPNRGQHTVMGPATGNNYGFRGGSGQERFLVHRADIAAAPGFFQIVSKVPSAPRVIAAPPLPPEPVEKSSPPPRPVPLSAVVDEDDKVDIIDSVRFDLQLLPGVTPKIAKGLSDANLKTPKDILSAGVAGLQEIKWVGEARAEAIYAYVNERYSKGD